MRPPLQIIALAVGLVALLVTVAADRAGSPDSRPARAGQAENLATAGDGCVVARGDGFELTLGEVQRLRRAQTPAPALDATTRLALDVRLAQWLTDGRFDPDAAPRDQLQRYRAEIGALMRQGERHVQTTFARVRADLGVTTGPCFVPRGA